MVSSKIFILIKELFPRVNKAKFTEEHIERIIEIAISYFNVDGYNELDDFFESKFSNLGKEWLEGYKTLISKITYEIYAWYYGATNNGFVTVRTNLKNTDKN